MWTSDCIFHMGTGIDAIGSGSCSRVDGLGNGASLGSALGVGNLGRGVLGKWSSNCVQVSKCKCRLVGFVPWISNLGGGNIGNLGFNCNRSRGPRSGPNIVDFSPCSRVDGLGEAVSRSSCS